jgi:hypothetical protein
MNEEGVEQINTSLNNHPFISFDMQHHHSDCDNEESHNIFLDPHHTPNEDSNLLGGNDEPSADYK